MTAAACFAVGPHARTVGDARRDRAGRVSRFGPAIRSGAWFSSLRCRYLPPSARPRAGRGGIRRPCHHNRQVSDCRRRFKRARRFSPANGATCCRWPRRASSSTREVRFTCRAMPWIAWDRLLSQSSVFGGHRRQPRTKVPRPSWGIVLTPDAGGPSPHPNYALACMVTRAHVAPAPWS